MVKITLDNDNLDIGLMMIIKVQDTINLIVWYYWFLTKCSEIQLVNLIQPIKQIILNLILQSSISAFILYTHTTYIY